MSLSLLKAFGFLYYTVAITSLIIFFTFFLRLNRARSNLFYIINKPISKSLITFYSILNIFIFYYFCSSIISFLFFYLLNELTTISFSYFILLGFHVYGITGQICSGKTSACDYLKRKYGASIISLDDLNREILRQDSVIQKIKKTFGERVITKGYGVEVVNRSELKKIIFNDKTQRKKLENITHTKIMMLFFKTLCTERFLKMKKFVFIENAILLRFNLFKMIIRGVLSICVSDENILIKRMMKRDNKNENKMTEETAKNILKNQMSLSEFKLKSDIVIYNDDNYENLELQIDNVMREINKYSENDKIFVN